MKRIGLVLLAALGLFACAPASTKAPPGKDAAAAVVDARPANNPLNNAYFGDLHVHTKVSIDSFLRSNMLTMEDAYRFAQGGEVQVAGGEHVKLDRPLDFVALTDHSESYQTYDLCVEGDGPFSRTPRCQELKKGDISLGVILNSGGENGMRDPKECPGGLDGCREAAKRVWRRVQDLARREYRPGVFTTFVGYEHSATYMGGHMHRNVIFGNEHVPDHAESAMDAVRNTDLWKWLDTACTAPCDVVAIPHNANNSWGMAFALETTAHQPYTTDDWKRRARYERLTEIFQIKGGSECGVGFGTTDEECGFNATPFRNCTDELKTRCYAEGSFVRNALKTGLKLKETLGFNPLKLGFVASTDTHNSTPGQVKESAYVGSIGLGDGSPKDRLANQLYRNPGGLAGIWAPQNTREALFGAMKRRETFGTSGPRIRVRFFGGWNFDATLASQPDYIARAYKTGVPMGGDLSPRGASAAPAFLVWAAQDPMSVPLRRIQVVKGWIDGGQSKEAIYDVVCSDGLKPDAATHRCPSNGATASLTDCSVTPDKGAAELKTVWRDPDFDARQPAFYYLRVFENPSCRWSTYDSLRLGRPVPPAPAPIQEERAWSSPIWYDPKG